MADFGGADAEAFRAEVKDWLAANYPAGLKDPKAKVDPNTMWNSSCSFVQRVPAEPRRNSAAGCVRRQGPQSAAAAASPPGLTGGPRRSPVGLTAGSAILPRWSADGQATQAPAPEQVVSRARVGMLSKHLIGRLDHRRLAGPPEMPSRQSPHCLMSACVKVGKEVIPASTSATLLASALIAWSSQARCWSDSVTGFVGLPSFAPPVSLLTCSSRPVLTPREVADRPGPPYFALMPSYMAWATASRDELSARRAL